MWHWVSTPTTKDLIDFLNKFAQIVALLVAGYWGYHLYQQTTKPGLETRSKIWVDINWSESSSSDTCLGSFTVNVKNDGITDFAITKYKVRAWVFSNSELLNKAGTNDEGKPVFINYDDLVNGKYGDLAKLFHDKGDTPGLVGQYPPGEEADLSWDFIFKNDKDKSVYFLIEPEIDGKPIKGSWAADAVCRLQGNKNQPNPQTGKP